MAMRLHSMLIRAPRTARAISSWLTSLPRSTSTQAVIGDSYPIAPGSLVHICCTHPATAVNISNGAEDAVSVQTHNADAALSTDNNSSSSSSSSSTSSSNSSSSGNKFSVQLLGNARNAVMDIVETSAAAGAAQLSAAIPSRFCSLNVSTAGGAVSVHQLNEAEMQVTSRGGSITVKRCKATNAAINSAREPGQGGRGGDIQVGELSASHLRLNSGGGSVTLSRVFGLDADLLSQGGDISINALYGKKANILSGAGHLTIGHMSCDGLATVDSAGGRLTVDGLEGNASILSAGGDIKVHLHEQFGRVLVDSSGGNIEAWISPLAAVTLQVAAAGGIDLDPALKVTGELGSSSLQGVTGGQSSGNAWQQQQQRVQHLQQQQQQQQHDHAMPETSSTSSSSSLNSSRLHKAAGEVADLAAAASPPAAAGSSDCDTGGSSGCCKAQNSSSSSAAAAGPVLSGSNDSCRGSVVRQLTINAGRGRVTLRSMGWMDGIRAKLQASKGRQ